jgi:LPXTG-motif cell wall-anchored protein
MKRRACSLALGTALMGAMVIAGAGSASAHTPSVSASCSGVQLTATSYDSSKENHWSATIGGVTTSGTFGASLNKTIPVPQGGATTSWSATIEASDGSYNSTKSGSVGPCGSVPVPDKPDPAVETKDVSTPNCDTLLVTTTHLARSIPFVYDESSNSWVPGTPGDWQVTGTQTRHVTLEECDAPLPPVLVEHRDLTDDDCTTFVTTTDHRAREAIYVFDGGAAWEWVQDGWTAWHTVSSDTADATLEACPPPAQPDPVVSSSDVTSQECDDDFETVTTSTSTTEYVLDEETRTWYLGEPVVVVTTVENPVDAIKCETGVLGESLDDDDTNAADDQSLPDTGGSSWGYGAAAGVLMLCGSLILIFQRRTRTRT